MKKYFAVISNSLKKNLAYRANSFIMMFSTLFSFAVLFYFWSSIYRQGNQIGTYSLSEIISYYIFITIFELLFSAGVSWEIGYEIKNGQIINNILRPIGYLEYKFSQLIGNFLHRLMFFLPVIVAVIFFLRNFLTHPQAESDYVFLALLVFAAFALNFLIYFIVGMLAFWVIDTTGFFFACLVIVSFMQGQWMPLDLLPKWFAELGNFLPFKYLFFVPVGIASGRETFDWSMLAISLTWCVVLFCLAKFLHEKGIKKYEGYGV